MTLNIMTDSIMNLVKGWIVIYNDNSVVTEDELIWKKVDKKRIKTLALKWNRKFWSISGKRNYVQFKRGCVSLLPCGTQVSEACCVERCIGYYDDGGSKVIYRVNELTGEMKIDVQDPR